MYRSRFESTFFFASFSDFWFFLNLFYKPWSKMLRMKIYFILFLFKFLVIHWFTKMTHFGIFLLLGGKFQTIFNVVGVLFFISHLTSLKNINITFSLTWHVFSSSMWYTNVIIFLNLRDIFDIFFAIHSSKKYIRCEDF